MVPSNHHQICHLYTINVRKLLHHSTLTLAATSKRLKTPNCRSHHQPETPARALAAETLTLERTLSDLANQAYGLTPAEIAVMWQTAPPGKSAPAPV